MEIFINRRNNTHTITAKVIATLIALCICIVSFPIISMADTDDKSLDDEENMEPYALQELDEYRTANTKQFLMSDNSIQAVMYNEPVHYNENGEWKDIDNTLEYQKRTDEDDFNGYITKNGNFNVKFAKKESSDKLVSINDDDCSLSWNLLNRNKVLSAISNIDFIDNQNNKDTKDSTIVEESVKNSSQSVVYNNILNNTNLEYTVNGNGLKENIILKKPLDDYTFSFEINVDNLKLDLQEDNSIAISDIKTGKQKYIIPAMFMYDAKNEYSNDIKVFLKQESNTTYKLTINANNDWIKDKSREFPITIDPQVQTKQVDKDIEVSCISSVKILENLAKDNRCILGGYDLKEGFTRILMQFNLPKLNTNDMVVDANLNLYETGIDYSEDKMDDAEIHAYMVKSFWSEATTWAVQPVYGLRSLDYDFLRKSDKSVISKGTAVLKNWNITKAVKEWYEGDSINYGIVLKDSNIMEDGGNIFGQFAIDSDKNTKAYPFLTISYRNNKGLENYWTYTSANIGSSNNAYINDYSGNVVATHTDAATSGNRSPVTVEHVYNSCNHNQLYTNIYPSTGYGWKLNVQQTVRSSKLYGLTGNIQKMYPYVYEDGDGTEHYFYAKTENNSTKYYDEDGLGLELKIVSNGYQIVDSNKNITTFNSLGNIISVKNNQKSPSSIIIEYTNDTLNNKSVPVISKIIDGSGHKITLNSKKVTNDDNKEFILLDSIIDEQGIVSNYLYSTTNELYTIDCAEEGKTTFSYSLNFSLINKIKDEKSKKSIAFDYKTILFSDTLNGFSLYNDNQKVQEVKCNRKTLNETKFTVSNAGKTNVTYMQFDNYGRTISTYNEKSNTKLFCASKNTYNAAVVNSNGSNIKQINTLASSSSSKASVENLVKNPSAETNNYWKAAQSVGQCTFTNGYGTNIKYSGNRSFKMVSTASTNDGRARLYQDFKSDVLEAGKTYTLSAYVKTYKIKQVSTKYGYGASISVATYTSDSADSSKAHSTNYSNFITDTTTSTDIDNGWIRLTTSFTVPENLTYARVNLLLRNAIGTVYFDNIQLEEGDTPSEYNYIENGCMRYRNSKYFPYMWQPYKTVSDTCDPEDYSLSYTLFGNINQNRYIYQDILISGSESDTYTIGGWARGFATCSNDSTIAFDICIRVTYSDGSFVWKPAAKFNSAVEEWQYATQTFDLSDGTNNEKTPVSIRICPRYRKQVNNAAFSNFQLIKNNGSNYTYDAEGNLTSSKTGYSNTTSNSYTGNNLTKSIDTFGYETTYNYDKYNNLTSTLSQRSVSTNYSYDSYGNATKIENVNKAGNLKLVNNTYYNSADTKNGISEGTYVTKTVDECNNETQYDYDNVSGNLNSITDPLGNKTNFKYGTDNTLLQIDNGNVKTLYGYENGNLSSITRQGDKNPTQNYNFEYNKYGSVSKVKVGNKLLYENYVDDKNLTLSKTYGNDDVNKTTYSNEGVILSQSLNEEKQYEWKYDKSGRVYKQIDDANGLYSLYNYDTMNKVSVKSTYSSSNKRKSITGFKYDKKGNVVELTNNTGGNTFYHRFTYGKDNLITQTKMATTKYYDYSYDSLNRLNKKSLHFNDNKTVDTNFAYYLSDRNSPDETLYRTRRIKQEVIDNNAYRYTYDKNGNIVSIEQGVRNGTTTTGKNFVKMISYQYDNINQLTRENNKYLNQTILYNYDGVGNISKKLLYPYAEGQVDENAVKVINYSYSDNDWHDLLTSYDGKSIEYDAIGNPISYLGNDLQWQGRQLTSFSNTETNCKYTYDASGLRTTKTVNGEKTYYQYNGGKVLYQETGNKKLYFWYDCFGNLCELYYNNGTTVAAYLVTCNSRGDVEGLYNTSGNLVAKYTYDTWGNTISIVDGSGNEITSEDNIAIINPIRYRNYYFDSETGLYYLQSRYYNPTIGRFLNADVYCDTSDSVIGTNMFVYCLNNPVVCFDSDGKQTATETISVVITEIFVCLDLQEVNKKMHGKKAKLTFGNLEEYKKEKTKLYREWFDGFNKWTAATGIANTIAGVLSGISDFVPKTEIKVALKVLPAITTLLKNFSGRYLSIQGSLIMTLSDLTIGGVASIAGLSASGGAKIFDSIFSVVFGELLDKWSKDCTENAAYNWYLLVKHIIT